MAIVEDVIVKFDLLGASKLQSQMQGISEYCKYMGLDFETTAVYLRDMGISFDEQGWAVNRTGEQIKDASGKLQTIREVIGKTGLKSRWFRGEFLSLMFITQGVTGAFRSLISIVPGFDAFMSASAKIIGASLVPGFIKWGNAILKLSERVANFIDKWDLSGIIADITFFGLGLFTLAGAFFALGISPGILKAITGGIDLLFGAGVASKLLGFGKNLSFISRLFLRFSIILSIFDTISGIFKGDVYQAVTGLIMGILAAVALITGALPAAIVALIGLVVWAGTKWKWLGDTIMTVLIGPKILIDSIIAAIDVLTGKLTFTEAVKGFGKRVAKGTLLEGFVPMATGGIVRKPTNALIGESGPEAVIPLGSGGFGNNITINVTGNNFRSRDDINYLVDKVKSALSLELRRSSI